MDNKVLGAIVFAVLLLCATAFGITAIVTSGGDGAPAPVVTSTPGPVETNDPLADLLEEVWGQQSSSDQQALCTFFKIDPDAAYDSFNDGADGLLPEDTFMEFFSVECDSTT